MERRSFFKMKLESFKSPRSMFSKLQISMVLIELFVVFLNVVVFLEDLLTLSNV